MRRDCYEKLDREYKEEGEPQSGIYMDSEVVDSIAIRSLKWHYWAIMTQIEDFENKGEGHPDDFQKNISLKYHLEKVLEYYGN